MDDFLKIVIGISGVFLVLIIIAFLTLQKKNKNKKTEYLKSLNSTTKSSMFSMDVFMQKYYLFCMYLPFIRRYTLKVRRRVEILNLQDEYLTRIETAKVMLKVIPTLVVLVILVLITTGQNYLLKCSLLMVCVFLVETFTAGTVDKLDTQLLKEQIDFFAEMRHAYHEYNMVEEAIYEVAQIDELPKVATQANRIYEILISDDPETELEKYYDIAPNPFLKEFAGVSYLTREFGDRKDEDGASLYLKNLNNITQEMQIEILKRDKLDYMFQSLSFIAMAPIFGIELIKKVAIGLFGFTKQFYDGKMGLIVEMGLIILTTICYILIRKIKDNSSKSNGASMENPWQSKVYSKPYVKSIIDLFIPKRKTKEYRMKVKLLKDSASPLKMEWLYVNKVGLFILTFTLVFVFTIITHKIQVNYVYTEPTSDYNLMGNMGEVDTKKAIAKTARQNKVINKLLNKIVIQKKDIGTSKPKKKSNLLEKKNEIIKTEEEIFKSKTTTDQKIIKEMKKLEEYKTMPHQDFDREIEQIKEKLKLLQSEHLKWFEILISLGLALVAYWAPEMILKFQFKMRQLEMENEVMEYQTIILMLMKIERVNVEMILEWIERYSNIFRDPIAKCVNDFESGPWEALEQLKNDVTFPQFVRIVESLQAAVEQIPIREAFDELDTEREYYREKRKDSNERLIDRKAMIGKTIGFAPMVILFVGYLIGPMVIIGFTSMGEAFQQMSAT